MEADCVNQHGSCSNAIIAISRVAALNLDADSGYKISIATGVKLPTCFAEEKILFSV